MKVSRLHNLPRLTITAVVVFAVAGPVVAMDVRPGVDLYRIVSGTRSYMDFSAEPLPAGALGTGSTSLTGLMPIRPWGADVAIRRLEPAHFGGNFTAKIRTIAAEMVWLRFRSDTPIIMADAYGVQRPYDLTCVIYPGPSFKGQMSLTENWIDTGGTMLPGDGRTGTFFDVKYSLTPVLADASMPTIWPPPVFYDRISLVDPVDWSHRPPKNAYADLAKNFYPGVDSADPAAPLQHLLFKGKYLSLELELLTPQPWMIADANKDNLVTDADYTVWADNYGRKYAEPGVGDWNWDFEVTDADYTIWADSFGQSVSAAPEPASLAMLALSALVVRRRR